MRGRAVALGVIGIVLDRDRRAAVGDGDALGHLQQAVEAVIGDGFGLRQVELVGDAGQLAVLGGWEADLEVSPHPKLSEGAEKSD